MVSPCEMQGLVWKDPISTHCKLPKFSLTLMSLENFTFKSLAFVADAHACANTGFGKVNTNWIPGC